MIRRVTVALTADAWRLGVNTLHDVVCTGEPPRGPTLRMSADRLRYERAGLVIVGNPGVRILVPWNGVVGVIEETEPQ